MTESLEHVRLAARLVRRRLGTLGLPVVPLFETEAALARAPEIVSAMLRDREIGGAVRGRWGGYLEVMVGYSDSSKESGVLPSRLRVAQAMRSIDALCARAGVTPIFFQGSGGSVDRGGGTIQEQTAWWPPGALRNYKVTVQGEMVERTLASPEISRRTLERIVRSAGSWESARRAAPGSPALERFAARVAASYRRAVHDEEFLRAVEQATPYRFLDALRIGSRPAKRGRRRVSVEGLRAIPWVLCWTQSRALFPTWWGVGSARRAARPWRV
jgi:phosphoenolpyruvate carboxylase